MFYFWIFDPWIFYFWRAAAFYLWFFHIWFCLLVGFLLVESHHFLHVIFLLLDFVLVDLYLGLLCVHLVFYFWFFRPKIGPKRGRKVCCSKIIDWHPSKYCFIFRLALYLHFTPSGKVPKIYFQSNLLNLVNSKSITFSKLAQKVKLLKIET